MSAKFIIKTRKNGEYEFNLLTGNGECILYSEGYSSLSACLNGIESVRKNSLIKDRFQMNTSYGGMFYFRLLASNKCQIGFSNKYSSIAGLENGRLSVQKNASIAIIENKVTPNV